MAPIAKENEILSPAPETALRPSASASIPADAAAKQQAVALEVEVTVNGARTVEGSDKREPFSESTKTVLIFGNGAVIRLASSVTPGQLLFLTNEKTKKEVVCQVVKSKNYRNVSGYVELEFTEAVVGFWGMRFPSDRIGSASPSATATLPAVGSIAKNVTPSLPRPAAIVTEIPPPSYVSPKVAEQKPVTPAATMRSSEPQLSASKFVAPSAPAQAAPVMPKPAEPVAQVPSTPASLMPELAVNAPPIKSAAPVSSTFDLPRAPESKASIFATPPQAPVSLSAVEVSSFSNKPEEFPSTPLIAPPAAKVPETDALKQQTARLQEQLSSMLFAEQPAAKPKEQPPAPSVVATSKPADPFEEILQFAKLESSAMPAKPAEMSRVVPVEMPKIAPPSVHSSLDNEELKIPSWLEPLARNAAAPSSTQELVERERNKRVAEHSSVEVDAPEPADVLQEESASELHVPNFGSELRTDAGESAAETGSRKSGKRLMFAAIAAVLLLAIGGGVWYLRQQSSGVQAGAVAPPRQTAAVVPAEPSQSQKIVAAQNNPPAQTSPATPVNSSSQINSNPSAASPSAAGGAFSPVSSKQPISQHNKEEVLAENSLAVQPKKSALGEVRLAAPKVTSHGKSQDNGEDAGLAMANDADSNSGTLTALSSTTGQPAAPAPALPVGGDVKQARLLSSVPPVYPSLAKSQHVSGDVRVDALIDANGRVTTMKIVSGPTLLHQSAMDALRLWKYQPASLNGGPVPMHLTVTIQFRLQ